nr:hypothetical protein [Fredinandcohnia onubensis]
MSKKDEIANLLQKKSVISPDGSSAKKVFTEVEYRNTVIQESSKKKATFDLDVQLHKKLKIEAVRQGKPMVDIVQEALENYLQNNL